MRYSQVIVAHLFGRSIVVGLGLLFEMLFSELTGAVTTLATGGAGGLIGRRITVGLLGLLRCEG